jgi:hypothetical protein
VELHRSGSGIERLRVAKLAIREIGRITEHRESKMPKMDPNLIRATGLECGLKQ